MKYLTRIALVLCMFLVVTAEDCGGDNNAEEQAGEQTIQMQEEAYRQVGMPDLTNFQELKFAKQIMELRDQEITTYTYTVDQNGQLHFVCQSVGFGLPYSTQMTSPQKPEYGWEHGGRGDYSLPQSEPNGLYMPDNVSATWILCVDESEGDVDPIYSEPKLLVSPFPLNEADSYYDAESQASTSTPGLSTPEAGPSSNDSTGE